MRLFNFRRGQTPLGNNNLANALVNRPVPIFDALGFSQFRYTRRLPSVAQNRPLYVNFGFRTSGLGGLVQGGIAFQPLGPNPNPNQ